MRPVSYTHLDVYKRQVIEVLKTISLIISLFEPMLVPSKTVPSSKIRNAFIASPYPFVVSDVYKRQVHDDRHIEKQHDRDDAGYKKRKIRPFVFLQVGECKPNVNRFKHAAHLLWSVPSRCLKSLSLIHI